MGLPFFRSPFLTSPRQAEGRVLFPLIFQDRQLGSGEISSSFSRSQRQSLGIAKPKFNFAALRRPVVPEFCNIGSICNRKEDVIYFSSKHRHCLLLILFRGNGATLGVTVSGVTG